MKKRTKSNNWRVYLGLILFCYITKLATQSSGGGSMFDSILDFLWSIKWILIVLFLFNELARVWHGYNHIQKLIQQTQEASSNINVVIERKLEIINQFKPIVSQYDDYEKNLQLTVSGDYRTSNEQASNALAYIHGVAMAFPELKADSNYNKFLDNISNNEQLLTERRETFNKVVNEYNTFISQLPICFLAMVLGFKKEEYFE